MTSTTGSAPANADPPCQVADSRDVAQAFSLLCRQFSTSAALGKLRGNPKAVVVSADSRSTIQRDTILPYVAWLGPAEQAFRPDASLASVPKDLATKSRPARAAAQPRVHTCSAFTLVELILVMALLGIVLAAAAPSLSRFFRGRALHSEASRFVALTHYARNRAVSEGIPMVLWIDPSERSYGLRAESSYAGTDPRAVEFKLADGIQVEPDPVTPANVIGLSSRQTTVIARDRPAIRFTPDGFIPLTNPARVALREDDSTTLWIGLSHNRLHYEVQTNIAPGQSR